MPVKLKLFIGCLPTTTNARTDLAVTLSLVGVFTRREDGAASYAWVSGRLLSVSGQACGANFGCPLGHRTMLGADGMGADPVEQQVGHRVGLLLEHKVADVVQCLEAVISGDITSAVLNALLHDRHIAVAPYEHRWDDDLFTGSAHILERYGPVPVEGGG